MAEEKKESDIDSLLSIGTWNVHNWRDAISKPNLDRCINALQQTPVDIIGLQEVMRYTFSHHDKNKVDIIQKLKYKLDFYDTSTQDTRNPITNTKANKAMTVSMLSKYKINQTIHITNRMQMNIIQYTKDLFIGIVVVHFNYRHEEYRIREYTQISKEIKKVINKIPLIFVGDFNALTKDDYTDKEWKQITKIRKDNRWESPQTELMKMITSKNNFFDSLYLFKETGIEQKADTNSKGKSQILQLNSDLNGSKWKSVLGKENLGTCAYDTRIDYVL